MEQNSEINKDINNNNVEKLDNISLLYRLRGHSKAVLSIDVNEKRQLLLSGSEVRIRLDSYLII